MAKKLIDVIREHLGLKRYEEFYLKDRKKSTKHRFTERSIEFFDKQFHNDWCECNPAILGELILDDIKVVVLPFKPTVGETYWTYTDDWQVKDKIWYGTYIDYCNQKMGCVFRSKAEAVERYSEKSKEIMEQGTTDNIAFEDFVK